MTPRPSCPKVIGQYRSAELKLPLSVPSLNLFGGFRSPTVRSAQLWLRVAVMLFQINFKSSKPVYLQLVDQVKAAAASGALRVGEPLPSIRPLAEELRVNRNTVAKAYTQLESEGVIETSQGRGSFLKAVQSPLKKDARRRMLVGEIDEAIVRAHHLQVTRTEFLDLVRERFDALADRQRAHEADKQGAS